MEYFFQPLIMSFREGLEAFLIIVILLKFLDKTNNRSLKKHVWKGASLGGILSFGMGMILFLISKSFGDISPISKLWESSVSFIAVLLVTTFIYWMITHSKQIKKHIEEQALLNLSTKGMFLLSLCMITREGAEISLFSFAGKYSIIPVLLGITLSAIVATLLYKSLIKVNLQTIFSVTLAYLILQAGFLLGYSIHEGLSALKEMNIIQSTSILYSKMFDLSNTILYHKEGALGIPLYVVFGWYSKPEWIQFIAQYSYTAVCFICWFKTKDTIKS